MLDFGYYNMDCMEGMKQFPDKYFELAIVDPPYGDGGGAWTNGERFGERFDRYRDKSQSNKREAIAWDVAPKQEYFDELFRVSQNQIIWGGNYFVMPPTRCFLIWRKTSVPENFSMAMCEYAWTSFKSNAKWYEAPANGQQGRFHPTQKPVVLYKWILSNYAKDGDKILDTHVGSASSLIACEDMGFKYVGFEISEAYYKKSSERLKLHKAQITISDLMADWRLP